MPASLPVARLLNQEPTSDGKPIGAFRKQWLPEANRRGDSLSPATLQLRFLDRTLTTRLEGDSLLDRLVFERSRYLHDQE